MGESLKTMGKNLLQIPTPTQTINGVTLTVENGTVIANGTATADITYVINISGFIEGNYYFSGCADGGSNTKYDVFMWDATTASRPKQWDRTTNAISLFDSSSQGKVYIIPSHSTSLRIRIRSGVVANNLTFKLMIRFGNVQDSTFEPYISSTINLSVLEHFPTGMKDCSQSSQVFDEKTESEAITRVGSADLGTIDWTYYTGGAEPVFYGAPDDLVRGVSGEIGNIKCPLYNVIASRTRGQFAAQASDLDFQITADARTVMIKNLAYTSKEAFASAMSGIYLYYQLGTPIETAIQTASLVSENTEIPLYEDNDILVGECDELLSAESGFVPVKIKYQDDETVYSQKIQLHVEK